MVDTDVLETYTSEVNRSNKGGSKPPIFNAKHLSCNDPPRYNFPENQEVVLTVDEIVNDSDNELVENVYARIPKRYSYIETIQGKTVLYRFMNCKSWCNECFTDEQIKDGLNEKDDKKYINPEWVRANWSKLSEKDKKKYGEVTHD